MKLKDYIPRGGRPEFARRVGISTAYLDMLCTGRQPSAALAARIDRATSGKVSKAELRPDIFGDFDHEASVADAG